MILITGSNGVLGAAFKRIKNKQFYLKQMIEAKKNQQTVALKKVKRLCKEFDFKAGLLINTLA